MDRKCDRLVVTAFTKYTTLDSRRHIDAVCSRVCQAGPALWFDRVSIRLMMKAIKAVTNWRVKLVSVRRKANGLHIGRT